MKKVIIYGLGVSGQAMYELLGDECEILLYRDGEGVPEWAEGCLLYTSDAADE